MHQKNFLHTDLKFEDLINSKMVSSIGISNLKINDVRTLIKYLTLNGQQFFKDFIDKSSIKEISTLKKVPEAPKNL